MKAPGRILVVMTRRIGDVLLTTPVMRSLRQAWPQARIEVLVFAGTEGVLLGNPDIDDVITVKQRSSFGEQLRLLARLWRRYDLALSMVPSDRPTLYAFAAGRHRVGMVAAGEKHAWKKWVLSQWIPFDNIATHTVLMHLGLVKLLGIESCYEVVAAWRPKNEEQVCQVLPFDPAAQDYAVLHVYPMYAYKMWSWNGWTELARWLGEQGLRVVLTGGGGREELAYVENLLQSLPVDTVNLAGKLELGGVACLLNRARAYVGPDTVVTHMAAALGVPTVALFGPSNPVKWGPWPTGYHEGTNPYQLKGTQKVSNVVLLQGEGECVPCMEEGCERRIGSSSKCLQELPASRAIAALQQLWDESTVQNMDVESKKK